MSVMSDNILKCKEEGMSDDEIMEACGCTKAFLELVTGKRKKIPNHAVWDEKSCQEWRRVTAAILRLFAEGVPMPQYYIEVRKMNKERGTYENCK